MPAGACRALLAVLPQRHGAAASPRDSALLLPGPQQLEGGRRGGWVPGDLTGDAGGCGPVPPAWLRPWAETAGLRESSRLPLAPYL